MNDVEHREQAAQLSSATRAGDLAGAYQTIQRLAADDAWPIALYAGFTMASRRPKAAFFSALQQQIANAARHKTDGFGLRALSRNSESERS